MGSVRGNIKKIVLSATLFCVIVLASFFFLRTSDSEVSEFTYEQEAFRDVFFSLMGESLARNLTDEDISRLDGVVPESNHEARDELQEAHWMAKHNLSEQIPHTLENLYTLIVREAEVTCLPHVAEHIGLYIQHNDSGMVEHSLEELDSVRENYIAYISFYQNKNVSKTYNAVNLTHVRIQVDRIKERLDAKQYQEALPIILQLQQLPC